MRASRSWLPFLIALPVLAGARGEAHAEPSGADRQAATVLFKDGKLLLDKGKVAEACRKLEDSLRLDPAAGTLLNLAVCHEKEGRTASAWYELNDALASARRDNRPERIKLAEEHIAALEPKLLRLSVEVPKEHDLPDLEVRRDGAVLARAGWGSATPVDPGDHKLEARAPGRLPWSETVKVDPSAPSRTVKIPALLPDPDAAKTPPPAPLASSSAASAAPPPPPPPPSSRGTTGIVATAVGGALLVTAGVVSIVAKSKYTDAIKDCSPQSCSLAASKQTKNAVKLADSATGLAAAGAVVLVVGVYLLATAPANPATASAPPRFLVSPLVAREGGGAFVSGTF